MTQMMKRIFTPFRGLALASLAGLFLFSGCSTVPETGRRQINLTSDAEVVRMSMAQFEMMKRQNRISNDPRMNEMLQRVGFRIAEQVFMDQPLAEWEFVVFDVPNEVNAFAMPGGKVGVFSGLFRLANTEDQLAAVIAHEIAHVTARHTHEQISQNMMLNAGGAVVGLTTGGIGSMIYGANMQGNMAAWDRAKEMEADHIGIFYMARAGYDPQAAVTVMEKMVALDGGGPTQWNSTHPSSTERLDRLYEYLDEAKAEYEEAKEFMF